MPWPKKRSEVNKILKDAYERYSGSSSTPLYYDPQGLEHTLNKQPISKSDLSYNKILIRGFETGIHQLNEACNRIWGVSELICQLYRNDGWFGKEYRIDFLQSTIVPRLYYSLLSTLVSNMSYFGSISYIILKDRQDGTRSRTYTNIVRIKNGIIYITRHEFINQILRKSTRVGCGWHFQVQRMYEGFQKHGYEVPECRKEMIYRMRRMREDYDYGTLAAATMSEQSFCMIYPYWRYVLDQIQDTIRLYKGFDATKLRGSNIRFERLYRNIENTLNEIQYESGVCKE